MKNKKIALILLSVSMSILVFAGCSSTKAPTTMKSSMKMNNTKTSNSTSMSKQ